MGLLGEKQFKVHRTQIVTNCDQSQRKNTLHNIGFRNQHVSIKKLTDCIVYMFQQKPNAYM